MPSTTMGKKTVTLGIMQRRNFQSGWRREELDFKRKGGMQAV